MNNIVHFVTEYSKRLSRPIKVHIFYTMWISTIELHWTQDLEDVRSTMAALDEVRAVEIEMDMELSPIEECYSFLQRCGVAVAREEMETVDSLRYNFKNLLTQAVCNNTHVYNLVAENCFCAGSDPRPIDQYPAQVQSQPSGECRGVPP